MTAGPAAPGDLAARWGRQRAGQVAPANLAVRARPAAISPDLVGYLTGVIATSHYPHLASALASSADSSADADALFARSLDRLISVIITPPE